MNKSIVFLSLLSGFCLYSSASAMEDDFFSDLTRARTKHQHAINNKDASINKQNLQLSQNQQPISDPQILQASQVQQQQQKNIESDISSIITNKNNGEPPRGLQTSIIKNEQQNQIDNLKNQSKSSQLKSCNKNESSQDEESKNNSDENSQKRSFLTGGEKLKYTRNKKGVFFHTTKEEATKNPSGVFTHNAVSESGVLGKMNRALDKFATSCKFNGDISGLRFVPGTNGEMSVQLEGKVTVNNKSILGYSKNLFHYQNKNDLDLFFNAIRPYLKNDKKTCEDAIANAKSALWSLRQECAQFNTDKREVSKIIQSQKK